VRELASRQTPNLEGQDLSRVISSRQAAFTTAKDSRLAPPKIFLYLLIHIIEATSSESDVYLRSVKLTEEAHIMSSESDVYLRFVKLTTRSDTNEGITKICRFRLEKPVWNDSTSQKKLINKNRLEDTASSRMLR